MSKSGDFSDYMVSYSVNRSINVSPTLGRLHKHKEPSSFGPTICLLNRSRQKIEESTTLDERQEILLSKVLLFSLQIEKLTEQNRRLKAQKEEWSSTDKLREKSLMREENQKLKKSAQKNEVAWKQQQRKYNSQIYQLKEKISVFQAENRTLNRRLKQNQKQIEEMLLKRRINQSIVQRAKMEASRLEMSMHINSTNIGLQKSIAKEKNMEIDSLRDKIMRCEQIIKDQKFIINGQKEQINKEKAKQDDVQNRYAMEIDFIRKQVNFTQNENAQINQEEIRKLQNQIKDWQSRVVRSEDQLKDKCLIIANQVKTINQQDDRCLQLQRRLQDLQFQNHSKIFRAEEALKLANKEKDRQSKKLNKEIEKYLQEIQMLKITIQHFKQNIAEKDLQVQQTTYEMSTKLKEKEQLVKRLKRRDKEQISQSKMNKSLSVDNIGLNNRLKASQVSLQQIVTSAVQLKKSNDRSTRLIEKSFTVKKDYYGI